jgi:hypothetical protein
LKTLVLAFFICAPLAGITYLGMVTLGVDKDVAKIVATLVLSAFPKLRDVLEKMEAERLGNAMPNQVKDFFSYKTHPVQALLYVTVAGYAALQLGSFFGGVVAGMLGAGIGGVAAAMGIIVPIFSFPLLYLCGRWIGRYCSAHPYPVAIGSAILIRAGAYFIDPLFLTPDEEQQLLAGERSFVQHFLLGALAYAALMLIGAYVGTKQQLTTYCGYLLGKLPRDSRLALVELAHEEAMRIKGAAPAAPK